MEFYAPDLRAGYVSLVDGVVTTGRPVTVRGLPTRELTNVTIIFENPLAPLLPVGVGRQVNPRLAALEALGLVGGAYRHDLVLRAAPDYGRVLLDRTDPDFGAYGPRVAAQVRAAVELLRDDPATRRAVVSIWRGYEDLTHDGDRPCTLTLQFLVRPPVTDANADPTLELYVSMRSQDVWLGVAYDCFMFQQLQHTVARELRLPAGRYVHRTTSLHVYERDVAATRRLHAPRGPTPDDLPLGVASPQRIQDLGVDTGFDAALALLDAALTDGAATDEWRASASRACNPWYARQLAALRPTTREAL